MVEMLPEELEVLVGHIGEGDALRETTSTSACMLIAALNPCSIAMLWLVLTSRLLIR